MFLPFLEWGGVGLQRMFAEILQKVVNDTDGAFAGVLMDSQGCTVERFVKAGPLDIEQVGAEMSVIVKQIQRAAESLEAGGTSEVAILSEKIATVLRIVNKEYFVAIALLPQGNMGKARYLLRMQTPKILELL